ncbi:MAG: M23 family metallopeptidase [Bacillota bacterium]|nr:M23 family metallopeptidase [Bacillota bacterium]
MDKLPNLKSISEFYRKLIEKPILSRKKAGAAVLIVLVLLSGVYLLYVSNTGYSVQINGTPVGIIKDKAIAESVVSEITEEIGEDLGKDSVIIGAELKLDKVRLSGEEIITREELKERIKNSIDLKRKAVTIYIDDQPVISLLGREAAEGVLDEIKHTFAVQQEGITFDDIRFKEKVEIEESAVEPEDLQNPEDAIRFLVNGTTETKVYTVKKGDSLWLISNNNNISVEDLEKANPGIDPKRLQIGQQLSMVVPKPFVTVVTEETRVYRERVPFETEYKESTEFFKGESIIKKNGSYGEREVTAKVVKENGQEVSRVILDEIVLKEPVSRLVALGTKPPPPSQGTGTFAYPARGTITSGFGWRWGRQHTGIDISVPVGTPVKAADGGTVTFAGRYGDYGNLVIIDHGDGYETYYGHNDELMVSKGDKVFKGQTIALSGKTGRVTGPHLHFEVRRFGVPADPMKYLSN